MRPNVPLSVRTPTCSLAIVDAITSPTSPDVTYYIYRPNFDTEPRDMTI